MKTVVLGGGIIGVTTAYYLTRAGVDVVVVDRQANVAMETSSVNTGVCAPGHSFAWASPSAPRTLFRSLYDKSAKIWMHPSKFDREMASWLVKFMAECTNAKSRENTLTKYRLSTYSRDLLLEAIDSERISYNQSPPGMLYLYRNEEKLEAALGVMQLLIERGENQRRVDAAEVLRIEPGLSGAKSHIGGAVYGPDDRGGECRAFAERLASTIIDRGGSFMFETQINGLEMSGNCVTGVYTDKGLVRGDNYVLAMGSRSTSFARQCGLKIPVYPIKGYSVTARVSDDSSVPTISGVDEETLVAWSRIGDRVRLTSTADVVGHDNSMKPTDFSNIVELGGRLFPGIDFKSAHYDVGFRPMTPDGPPGIGLMGPSNLYLNVGHGHLGFTMSCGSGKIVSDLITGESPDIDLAGINASRWA